MKLLISVFMLLSLIGCSNPHKAKDLNTKMENEAGTVSGEKVGVKDGDMVIQRKRSLAEELRRIQYDVYELEDRVYGNRKYGSTGLYGVLKTCRMKRSDRDYGGDGKMKWTEKSERITDVEPELTLGLDEDKKLVAISEEYIVDRINRFKKHKKLLMSREDEYQEKVEICQTKLKDQVYKHRQIEEKDPTLLREGTGFF